MACERHGDLVLEGGSVHTDGEGTLLATEECLLHGGRNPALDKAAIEARLCAALGASKVVWLPRGVVGDEDTNGHVDNLCCFAAPGVVALGWSDRDGDPMAAVAREALAALEAATDAKGRRFSVHKVDMPPPMHFTAEEVAGLALGDAHDDRTPGQLIAASYINFYVCNGAVVVPAFGDAAADAKAASQIGALFPGRAVAQVASREIALGGGGIHCITCQQPEGGGQ